MINGTKGLGDALGVSKVSAASYIKDPRWTFGRGPWKESQVPAMAAWRARYKGGPQAEPTGDGEPVNPLTELARYSPEQKAKLQLTLTRTKKLQAELEQFLGDYVRKDEVERGRTERVAAVQQGLRNLVHTLAPKLVGLDAVGIEGVLEAEFREMCNRFANG